MSSCTRASDGPDGRSRGSRNLAGGEVQRRQSHGVVRDESTVHHFHHWAVLRTPASSTSTAVSSKAGGGGCGHDNDMAGRRRASGTAALALEDVRGDRDRGETKRGSPRVVWRRQRARGRPDGD